MLRMTTFLHCVCVEWQHSCTMRRMTHILALSMRRMTTFLHWVCAEWQHYCTEYAQNDNILELSEYAQNDNIFALSMLRMTTFLLCVCVEWQHSCTIRRMTTFLHWVCAEWQHSCTEYVQNDNTLALSMLRMTTFLHWVCAEWQHSCNMRRMSKFLHYAQNDNILALCAEWQHSCTEYAQNDNILALSMRRMPCFHWTLTVGRKNLDHTRTELNGIRPLLSMHKITHTTLLNPEFGQWIWLNYTTFILSLRMQ